MPVAQLGSAIATTTKEASMASTQDPDYAGQILNDVREQIAVDDGVLSETKDRRNLVKRVARKFDGALKTFDSGSVAHGTVNKPVSDADCGVVLDRRRYPQLGPDGEDVPPDDIVREIAEFVIAGVREEYPDATYEIGKRSIVIRFNEQLGEEQDPSVDLIVALTRTNGDGRWIPNTQAHRWDASDPEKHTELLNGPTVSARVHRARVIRLAKAAVKQDETPVISSFNIEALALDHVDGGHTIAESLRDLFLGAAYDLAAGNTPDPAGVSDPIKLPEGISRDQGVERLRGFGNDVAEAIENTEDADRARAALARVFPDYVEAGPPAKARLAEALTVGDSSAVGAALGSGAASLKRTAAYGDGPAS
jgi:Second Messenger Oligonucleotide or Dinucleotide Synthetase domain